MAKATVCAAMANNPKLKVTVPYQVEDSGILAKAFASVSVARPMQ